MSEKFKTLIMQKVVPEGHNLSFAPITASLMDEIIKVCNEVKTDLDHNNSYNLASIELFKKMDAIINSDMDWSVKYDLVFSDTISETLNEMVGLDWICSEESDEKDLMAYYQAVKNKINF